MVNLTRCLARAEAKNGILSYCIAPGFVETAMARDSVRDLGPEALTADIPLKRTAAVKDVAGVAVFLATNAANYLTGITIPVNQDAQNTPSLPMVGHDILPVAGNGGSLSVIHRYLVAPACL